MVGIPEKFSRHDFKESLLDGKGGFPGGKARAVGYAKDMGIHSNGRLPKNRVENDIGGFAPHPRERLQGLALCRYFAAILLPDDPRQGMDVFCLAAEKPKALNMCADFVFSQFPEAFGIGCLGKKGIGTEVYGPIGTLRRKHHRHQELKR